MPKRSTGCFECRKRKVGCDGAKPECGICVRRGTKCPGYRPTQSFIFHKFDKQAGISAQIEGEESRCKLVNQCSTHSAHGKIVPASQLRLQDESIPKQVSSMAADRIQHLGIFIALYLPKAGGPALPPPSALMLGLPTMPADSPVLPAAVDALSAAQLAVKNKSQNLVNRSRSLYCTALTHMLRSIQDPETALKDETLLSTYLLTLYEVFVGVTQGHGFFYHVQGLLHLLKQRGSSSFQSRLSMQIFHAVRYHSLSIGYHLRKASMLDSPEWLAVTIKAAKVDPYVALQDICIGIPRLLERADKIGQDGCSPTEIDILLEDSHSMASRASEWLSGFEKNGPRYDKVDIADMKGFLDICPDRVFDTVYDFHYFGAGICYMIYSMSMLIMQSNTFKLLRQYRQLELKQMAMWDRQLNDYADTICRSIPYHCRPVTGYSAKLGCLTPLVVAMKYFQAKGAKIESQWCGAVYMGTKVPGLYQATTSMEPLRAVQATVKGNNRFL